MSPELFIAGRVSSVALAVAPSVRRTLSLLFVHPRNLWCLRVPYSFVEVTASHPIVTGGTRVAWARRMSPFDNEMRYT